MSPLRPVLMVLVLTATAFAGCISTDDGAPVAPTEADTADDEAGGPGQSATARFGECAEATGVQNQPAAFQYSGSVACSGEQVFDWTNPAPRAVVQWGGSIATGAVTLTISDALGTEVYSVRLEGTSAGGAQAFTDWGVPTVVSPLAGPWTIRLAFEDAMVSMGLQIASG